MTNEKKKIIMSSEITYFLAIAILAFAVAILTAADFGISVIVAPAYLISLKIGTITFGQAEYIVQGILFVLLCFALGKFKISFLMSFVTCLIYGAVLDLWRLLPLFNPNITPPGSMAPTPRIAMFVIGAVLTAFAVALFFKTYLCPQVNDFFVKAVANRCGIKISIFKTATDIAYLIVSLLLSYCFFGQLTALGWGTVVMALLNGTVIGFFSVLLDKVFEFKPCLKRFSTFFTLNEA